MHLQRFDIGKWHGKLISAPASFETLASFIEHPAAAEEFKRSIGISFSSTSGEKPEGVTESSGRMEQIRNHIYGSALLAVEHYAALMVVTAATYVENMVFEFFAALFTANPPAMHRYLMGDESTRGGAVVPLQEVLDASDLGDLRFALALRAAKNANNGSLIKVISRIEMITKRAFPGDVSDSIVEVVQLRNRIVHDGWQPTREAANVSARYQSLEDLLAELGRQCQDFGIPIFDPGFLVEEPPPPAEPPDWYRFD